MGNRIADFGSKSSIIYYSIPISQSAIRDILGFHPSHRGKFRQLRDRPAQIPDMRPDFPLRYVPSNYFLQIAGILDRFHPISFQPSSGSKRTFLVFCIQEEGWSVKGLLKLAHPQFLIQAPGPGVQQKCCRRAKRGDAPIPSAVASLISDFT